MRNVLFACLALAVAVEDSLHGIATKVGDVRTAGEALLEQLPTEGEGGNIEVVATPLPQDRELASDFRARGGTPGPIPDTAIFVGWVLPAVDAGEPLPDESYGNFLARGGERVSGPGGAPLSPFATWDGAGWTVAA